MVERIQQLLKQKKLSASQLADETGIQRSSVSHVLSGRNKPSLDFITKIITAYPDISSEWLMTGKGTMYIEERLNSPLKSAPGHQTEIEMELRSEDSASNVRKAHPEKETRDIKTKAGGKINAPGSNSVEKIIILYVDGTFSEYVPQD